MTTPNDRTPRKMDASNGSVLNVRLREEDWTLLRQLRAFLASPAVEPTDSEIVRFALREAHERHAQKDKQ